MYIGIDVGSRSAKGILFDGSNIVDGVLCDTGINPRIAGEIVFDELLKSSGVSSSGIKKIVGTGYGRVSLDMADKCFTEISCHAKGAFFVCPEVQTVIDVGGQDCKVIRVNNKGGVDDFSMNDKCAAGTGRFFEVAAKALEMDISDFSIESSAEPCEISNMCVVFAESEIISLLAKETPVESIASGINKTFAGRIAAMAKRHGDTGNTVFVGGAAKNDALRKEVSRLLETDFLDFDVDPQLMGALGASVIASEL